jgi:hypothetical protein
VPSPTREMKCSQCGQIVLTEPAPDAPMEANWQLAVAGVDLSASSSTTERPQDMRSQQHSRSVGGSA